MRGREENDPVLQPLLQAATGEERELRLERLLSEHAYSRIDVALDSRYRQSSLSPHLRDDLRAEVVLRLIRRLHALVHDDRAEPVTSFCAYVSVVSFNTFDNFLRRSHPMRSRLKNRIRYALRHDPQLAEWECNGELVAGLATDSKKPCPALDSLDPPARPSASGLPALLRTLLEEAGRPVKMHALVAAVAELQNVPGGEPVQPLALVEAADHPKFADDLANAAYLREVWTEIRELPVRQRMALLLNARDAAGESALRFLPVTGIASIRQIGETLGIEAGTLAEFWNELPLEDTKIAAMLDVTRQQVINLRQAARNRLARRLRHEPRRGRRAS